MLNYVSVFFFTKAKLLLISYPVFPLGFNVQSENTMTEAKEIEGDNCL